MRTEPLTLHHRDLLYTRLQSVRCGISEYSFANLYLFRAAHSYEVVFYDSELFVRGTTYNGQSYLMPTRDVRDMDPVLLNDAIRSVGMLFPVAQEWLSVLPETQYNSSFDAAESDYIHNVAKMTSYPGSHLHPKKNLRTQFLKLYQHEALPLTTDRLPLARSILDAWQTEQSSEPSTTDYAACSQAIELYDTLVLCGGIYLVGGEPAGFIIGEEIDPSMFVLHFAKAKRQYKGIYQFMYSHFASIMPSAYSALNFEQDLGIADLRKAKSSYQPERMILKYRITPRV